MSTTRRLEEDHGALLVDQGLEGPSLLAGLAGEEPFEAEAVAGKPGYGQSRQHGGGPRRDCHGHALIGRGDDEPVSGVRYRRHAGVGDDQDAATGARLVEQLGRPGTLIVLMEGEKSSAHPHPETLSQCEEAPGVLGGDDVGLLEPGQQTRGGVANIPDRGGGQGNGATARRVGNARRSSGTRDLRRGLNRRDDVIHSPSMASRLDSRP